MIFDRFNRRRASQRQQNGEQGAQGQQEQSGSGVAVLDASASQAGQVGGKSATRRQAGTEQQGSFTVDLMDDWCKP